MHDLDDILARLKRLHPLMIDLSLGRVLRLLDRLGNPQRRFPPVIHIAGTNGKGSTTAYLKAMLEAAGRRVHVYTSPHLVRFNERIAVPGPDGHSEPIEESLLVDYLAKVEAINAGDPITFFEVTMAAAFLAFAEIPADAVLLEVGLGGDFDSTNVVEHPAMTVITPIAMDHAERLGDTIAKIARVKAGILKPGSPAVIALQQACALEVVRARAAEIKAGPLAVGGEDYEAFVQRGRLVYQSEDEVLDLPLPALIGPHQVINAGTAIAAARGLKTLGISERAIEQGLVTVKWPARMQRLTGGKIVAPLPPETEVWLDGGHNPHGAQAIAQTLADLEERAPKPLAMIVGMMGQKDAAGFLAPFRGLARRIITVPIPGAHEKPHEPAALAEIARQLGFKVEAAAGVPEALERLRGQQSGPMRILICGSLYLAGQVLALQDGRAIQSN